MQLFATQSYEFKLNKGFDFIPGEVKKIPMNGDFRIPNIGWRQLVMDKNKNGFDLSFNKMMYFVHSYTFYPKEKCNIKSYIKLGKNNIPAIVKKNNVVGFQFHPERSGEEGLGLLERYLRNLS